MTGPASRSRGFSAPSSSFPFSVKRLISVVLVLLALGVAAFFFFKLRRYLPERPRAAELAPPDTIYFVQIPNVRQTVLRIPQTDLYQIWREDDVQAFLAKPRQKAPWMQEWTQWFDETVRAAPGEVFVAITALEPKKVSFVGGFSYAGSRHQAEELVEHVLAKALPSAKKADGRTPEGVHIESYVHPGGELQTRFHDNWFFFASDTALLTAVIQRFDADPVGSLGDDPIFKKTPAALGGAYDFVVFAKPGATAGRLALLTGVDTKPAPDGVFSIGTKIEAGKLHDTIFLSGTDTREARPLARETLALAPAQTLLFYASELPVLDTLPATAALLPGFAEAQKRLAAKGLSWGSLSEAVGPEIGTTLEWPEEAALPMVLLATPIRDAAKAGLFADALTSQGVVGAAWPMEESQAGKTFSSPGTGFALIHPTVTLTPKFAMAGSSAETITAALPRLTAPPASRLEQNPVFQDVIRFVPPQATAFGYLDFRRLFERTYRMARPFITLSLAFSPDLGTQFDAGKLPPVEAISKHLSATVLSEVRTPDGFILDSYGTLTLPNLFFGLGAAGMAAGLPKLEGMLPGNLQHSLSLPGLSAPSPAPASGNPSVVEEPPDPVPSPEKMPAAHK
jgi:hypothetical protein